MASKADLYIGEAYKQLEVISQDREKQIEYTSQQKAIMEERYEKGLQEGLQKAKKELYSQLMTKWKNKECLMKIFKNHLIDIQKIYSD